MFSFFLLTFINGMGIILKPIVNVYVRNRATGAYCPVGFSGKHKLLDSLMEDPEFTAVYSPVSIVLSENN